MNIILYDTSVTGHGLLKPCYWFADKIIDGVEGVQDSLQNGVYDWVDAQLFLIQTVKAVGYVALAILTSPLTTLLFIGGCAVKGVVALIWGGRRFTIQQVGSFRANARDIYDDVALRARSWQSLATHQAHIEATQSGKLLLTRCAERARQINEMITNDSQSQNTSRSRSGKVAERAPAFNGVYVCKDTSPEQYIQAMALVKTEGITARTNSGRKTYVKIVHLITHPYNIRVRANRRPTRVVNEARRVLAAARRGPGVAQREQGSALRVRDMGPRVQSPAQRVQGAASALIAHLARDLPHGRDGLFVEVPDDAVEFFENRGFEHVPASQAVSEDGVESHMNFTRILADHQMVLSTERIQRLYA